MNNSLFYDYTDVLEIYSSSSPSEQMVSNLERVITYYLDGDRWHGKHFKQLDRDEHTELTVFLSQLTELAKKMATLQERALIIQEGDLKLNLNPWIKFIDSHSVTEMVLYIRTIKCYMALYLNEDNILEYRACLHIMEQWEYGLNEMMMKGESNE